MKIGPKYKICKRLGSDVFEKCQTQKFQLAEARTKKGGPRGGRRNISDYGKQLLEKQKVRFSYGITEKQLRKYMSAAAGSENQIDAMQTALEMRLDNVVYRAGFAQTRRMARQLVSHGHVSVNGRRLKVPSHAVQVNDEVSVRDGSKEKTVFADVKESKETTEKWLVVDKKKLTASIKSTPEFGTTRVFDLGAVFEFYSR